MNHLRKSWQNYSKLLPQRSACEASLSDREKELLSILRRRGFVIIEHYFSNDICNKLISLFESWLETFSSYVETQSDCRLFGVERLDPTIQAFADDSSFRRIASAFVGRPQKAVLTMGNKLVAADAPDADVRASGGDEWHRDRMQLQMKSLVYLADVDDQSGPFTIIRDSKRPLNFFGDFLLAKGDDRVRWDHQALRRRVVFFERRITKLSARAGSVILFDASALHRGWPIKAGRRYALTNYYRDENFDPRSAKNRKKFPNLLPASLG